MQVILNADAHTDGRLAMSDYLEAELKDGLGHYGERITRVEAHLSEAKDSTKANSSEVHCSLEARLVGFDPVVVKEAAATAHQAIHGAIRKLARAVGSHLEKHDPRHATRPAGP
jgi:ribosome-associated translation inhibitor RaiA